MAANDDRGNEPTLRMQFCDVHIQKSDRHGLGLFATRTIPKNNVIALYPGSVTATLPVDGSFKKGDDVVWDDLQNIRQSDYAICTPIQTSGEGDWCFALFEPTNVSETITECSALSDTELLSYRFQKSFPYRAVFANESLFPNARLVSPMQAYPLLCSIMTTEELYNFYFNPRPVLVSTKSIFSNREICVEYNNDDSRGYNFSDIMLAKKLFEEKLLDGRCALKRNVASVYLRRLQQIINLGIPITLQTRHIEFVRMLKKDLNIQKLAQRYKGGWKKLICDYWAIMPHLNPSLKNSDKL